VQCKRLCTGVKQEKKPYTILIKWADFFKPLPKICPVRVHIGKGGEGGRGRRYQTGQYILL